MPIETQDDKLLTFFLCNVSPSHITSVLRLQFNIRNTLPKFGTFFLGHPVESFVVLGFVIPTFGH